MPTSSTSTQVPPPTSPAPLTVAMSENEASTNSVHTLFLQCLLSNMREGAIFIGREQRITIWNSAVEQMTGISESIVGSVLTPSLLRMRNLDGQIVRNDQDPIRNWLSDGVPTNQKFLIAGRSGRESQVDFNFHPVLSRDGHVLGAVILLLDTSTQIELQRQLKDLYAMAVLDPLTQVANRAEFERILDEYVRTHHQVGLKCGIIVCDLDFFKQINDNYGHHIGDQALISFAQLLRQFIRSQDFVARYGGEEFVILCANCDEASAAQRADEIRDLLARTPQTMLNNKSMTASFGVTELHRDDTAKSFFIRADQALLRAKELGRNRVVCAGFDELNGSHPPGEPEPQKPATIEFASGVAWRPISGKPSIVAEYACKTPIAVVSEKLRGFVEEQDGTIIDVKDDLIIFSIDRRTPMSRHKRHRFTIEIDIATPAQASANVDLPKSTKLLLRIAIYPGRKGRWLRNTTEVEELARMVFRDLRMYISLTDDCRLKMVERAITQRSRY